MKTLISIGILCLSIFGGCIPLSISSLDSDPSELVSEPALEGIWSEDDEETWELRKGDDQTYLLTGTDENGATAEFRAGLVELGDALIMQVSASEDAVNVDEDIRLHLAFLHSFYLIKLDTATLQIATMNQDYLREVLKDDPSLVTHTISGSDILLTASTANLKKFMTYAVAHDGFFDEFETFKKIQD